MKRTKHSLSHYKLLTCDMGRLVPVACFDVLPGDSIQQATSLLIRMNPLVAPVMHPVTVRVHHWFVPYRLLWEDWEDFITGGSDGEGDGVGSPPTITADAGGFGIGTVADYLGFPTGIGTITVSAFPARAYNKIFNEFYRDQDLVLEQAEDQVDVPAYSISWEKDYFTMARPWSQKGPDISLPLGTTAPVNTGAVEHDTNGGLVLKMRRLDGTFPPTGQNVGVSGVGDVFEATATSGPGNASLYPTNLYADLAAATAVDVNTVRRAFALQRYQEARAMYGSRYTEYLRYLGVRSSDARLQRPEYLGGGKQTISFTEVLQTAPTTDGDDTEGVGNLKGHGIAAMRSRRYRRFFEEHGLVLSLMSARPRTMYSDGVPRMWRRTTKEDFWQKELEDIGQQEVHVRELWAGGSDTVFGYSDRYAEYRHIQSSIAGLFRTTLNYWHLGRLFAGQPVLNAAFVQADPSTRIFAAPVTSGNMLCMANHSIQARRMVKHGGQPGRII